MIDRYKLLKGLRSCSGTNLCETCPYKNMSPDCISEIMDDALKLLEDQDPIEPNIVQSNNHVDLYFLECPKCGEILKYRDAYCKGCGRKMKWE